jgi:hypothetical protein
MQCGSLHGGDGVSAAFLTPVWLFASAARLHQCAAMGGPVAVHWIAVLHALFTTVGALRAPCLFRILAEP